MLKKIILRAFLAIAFVVLLGVTAIAGLIWWDMPPKSTREYFSLRHEWDEFNMSRPTKQARLANDRAMIERCFELAENYPATAGELAALMLADKQAIGIPERERVSERLRERIASADFDHLVTCSGYGIPSSMSADVAAPLFLVRTKDRLDHPKAAWVLCSIAASAGSGSEASEPPALYSEVADLVVERFAESPDVINLCSTLGNGKFSPPWAFRFETHLEKILAANHDRLVRCAATLALAEIAHASPERQQEAESRYRKFLAEFDGTVEYGGQYLEQYYIEDAKQRLEAMQFAPIGKPAPEIAGLDLDGQPLTLSEYRGRVVLVAFWATWCAPCMRMAEHERALAEQYREAPFAVVGVNADDDLEHAREVAREKRVTWRSFRDKGADGKEISDDWRALFPTVYLIDHEGIVRERYSGNPTPAELDRAVETLVAAARKEGR